MDTTQKSLLFRIRDHRDEIAWREFHEIYAPFLYNYARKKGLTHEDAEDVRAHCLDAVARHIKTFDYQRERGGFRNWLRRAVTNKIINLRNKAAVPLARTHQLDAAVGEQEQDRIWEAEWADTRLRYCFERIRHDVPDKTLNAFHLLVLEQKPVEEVCRLLGINANQAYKAKSEVYKRLRIEMTAFDAELDAQQ